MTETVPVANLASLPEERFALLRCELSKQSSMERARGWFFSVNPKLAPEDLVAQDEFSYDLLVPFGNALYLSYDTS